MNRKDMIAPCKDCTERHAACHSECGKYQQYTENRKALNEWQRDMARIEGVIATRSKRIERDAKRRRDEKNRKR